MPSNIATTTSRVDGSSMNVRVVARIRPLNLAEETRGLHQSVYADASVSSSTLLCSPSSVSTASRSKASPSGRSISACTTFSSTTTTANDDIENSSIASSTSRKSTLSKRFLSKLKPIRSALTPGAKKKKKQKARATNRHKPPNAVLSDSTLSATNVNIPETPRRCMTKISGDDSNCNKSALSVPTRVLVTTSKSMTRQFDFDAVFGPDATQEHVYQRAVGDAVARVCSGFHATILAYGQTGSGKTYSMAGGRDARTLAGDDAASATPVRSNVSSDIHLRRNKSVCGSSSSNYTLAEDDGISCRALHDLFTAKEDVTKTGTLVEIMFSCLEIYNDELKDLLVDEGPSLQFRDQGGSVEVLGLKEVAVDSLEQVRDLMGEATERRTTAATRMNERSSRSHAITTLKVKIINKQQKLKQVSIGKLTLVDLAGSERIKDTGVVGVQQQESININKDLFVLGKVISALSEREKRGSLTKTHIPYRDSKLTRLLRDSLGGNCCTVLIACVSPSNMHVEESINTLRYAERARAIKNNAKQNITRAELTPQKSIELATENERLKEQVLELQWRILELEGQRIKRGDEVAAKRESSKNSLRGLRAKLSHAQAQVKEVQEISREIRNTADRWKVRYEQINSDSNKPHKSGNKKEQEDQAAFEGDSILQDITYIQVSSPAALSQSTSEEESIKASVVTLLAEKNALSQEVEQLNANLLAMRKEFAEFEATFRHRASELQKIIKREEKRKCELGQEVSNMKLRVHLLASDLKNESEKKISFGSILRSLSGENNNRTTESAAEVEMSTFTSDMMPLDAESRFTVKALKEKIRFLEGQLAKERLKTKSHVQQDISPNKVSSSTPIIVDNIYSKPNDNKEECSKTPCSPNVVEETSGDDCQSSDDSNRDDESVHSKIRSHAEKMLYWADRAIERSRCASQSVCSSIAGESIGTDLRPSLFVTEKNLPDRSACAADLLLRPPVYEIHTCEVGNEFRRVSACDCEKSMFNGKVEYVEFYLPKISVSCTCGKQLAEFDGDGDPCTLENILRPWQVAFLKAEGIHTALDFIHVARERSGTLARKMRRWRKKKGLSSIKTKSCSVALHIWASTCKSVIKRIRRQRAEGIENPSRPDFLDITMISDCNTVSTIGFDSIKEV